MLGEWPPMTNGSERLRQQIIEQTEQYFGEAFPPMEFTSGVTPVPVSGKVIDAVSWIDGGDAGLLGGSNARVRNGTES